MRRFNVSQQAHKGFTILELMITVAVGAIAMAIAVPNMQSFVENQRQATSSNKLLSSLLAARDEALTNNVRVTVCPSRNGTSCQAVNWDQGHIAFIDLDSDQVVDAGDRMVAIGESASSGIGIETGSFGTFLMYRPNGRIMVNNTGENEGTFAICDDRGGSKARTLTINTSGRPRISYGATCAIDTI